MAIVLIFVDAKGMIRERFLDLVHGHDTLSTTLKTSLWKQLLHYQFDVNKFVVKVTNALVCASKEVISAHQFINKMVSTINVVCASSKCHDALQIAKANEVKRLLELGEIKSGSGLNQVGTLRRAGDTRWSSIITLFVVFLTCFLPLVLFSKE
ncbi:uncharacterized protein LOC143560558 [Bidens hawaiensis]|uniref:uncharacterized protein LOC143560558 n=1 Tax=Bidens hawaiensis TaxID=980011 RepID=UPI00404B42F4